MDEAIQNISPQPSVVIVTLAKQAAITAVKEQLRQQGLKPAYMAKREIVALAEEYLFEHRDVARTDMGARLLGSGTAGALRSRATQAPAPA